MSHTIPLISSAQLYRLIRDWRDSGRISESDFTRAMVLLDAMGDEE